MFARHRLAYWAIAGAAVAALVLALEAPWLQTMFRMTQPAPVVLCASVAVAVASGAWLRLLGLRPARLQPTQRSAVRPIIPLQ